MLKTTKTESEEKKNNPDTVLINILNLELPDEDPKEYDIKATFLDQLVISGTITSNKKRTKHEALTGQIEYDPSDYHRMNKFADTPLAVLIQPAIVYEYHQTEEIEQNPEEELDEEVQEESNNFGIDSYYSNIDIVQIFTDVDHLVVEKRMECTTRSVLYAKSWENLPLISIEIIAKRNENNAQHHKVLRDANFLKFTLIGCYNMKISNDDIFSHACVTEMPVCNEESTYIALFDKGGPVPKRFDLTSFYPKWESLRAEEESYAKSDEKFSCDSLNEFHNPENFDLDRIDNKNVVLWTSFHRSLIVKSAEKWLYNYFHHDKWPLEVHLCGEGERYCFVAFLDLMILIYPGEHNIRLAVPLQHVHVELSPEECVGEYLVSRTVSSTKIGSTITNKGTSETNPTNSDTNSSIASVTDSDGDNPFILVEIKLARPLKKSSIPPSVTNNELMEMLRKEEQCAQPRRCSGRSHTDRHWRELVRTAAQMLYTLPQRCNVSQYWSSPRTAAQPLYTLPRRSTVTSLLQQSAQARRCSGRSHTGRHWRERARIAAQMLYTLLQRGTVTSLLQQPAQARRCSGRSHTGRHWRERVRTAAQMLYTLLQRGNVSSLLQQPAQPRRCSGRSHTDRHWRKRGRTAAQLLYTLPRRDVCTFDHDFIRSKTQVEIESSFWQEAAHYVNNNFIASQFLKSDEAFEELRMMAHIHMMRAATEAVVGAPDFEERSRSLQAARQARQIQDVPHAIDLYLQLLAMNQRDSDLWRELATCFKDVDKKLANVCNDKALKLNPRHPLSLLSKACLVMDEDLEEAEVFFLAILALYPFCTLLWIATSAYYFLRGLHNISEQMIAYVKSIISEDIPESPLFVRAWSRELGDWWDPTPILAGCTPYYDAADLLLRIRGITLAEVCVALSLAEAGATPMYHHLLALCCRLRGEVNTALCHLEHARRRSGACYLYSLEGECHYIKGNWTAAKMCLEKSIYYGQPFSILLAISTSCLTRHDINVTRSVLMDLVRRQPSAYSWTKLAQFFMMNTNTLGRMDAPSSSGDQDSPDLSIRYIVACAEQALKYDRYFEYAWTILSRTVQPTARRVHCQNMATWCSHMFDGLSFGMNSKLPHGDLIGKTMEECQCQDKEL